MKKFTLILSASDEYFFVAKDFETTEIPQIGEEIYLGEYGTLSIFEEVTTIRHYLERDYIEVRCSSHLHDIVIATQQYPLWAIFASSPSSMEKFKKLKEKV